MTSLPRPAADAGDIDDTGEHPPDQALLDAALAGNEQAFRQLYRRHTPRLRRLAQRLLGATGGESDDAVQEVWLRAMVAARSFRWQSSLSTWLCAITARVASEQLRALRRHPMLELDVDTEAPRHDPVGRVDIDDAIARVPAHYRAVFVLHDIEGHTHEEIAELLGMAVGTSKANLHRARRLMRTFLGGRSSGRES